MGRYHVRDEWHLSRSSVLFHLPQDSCLMCQMNTSLSWLQRMMAGQGDVEVGC